MKFDYQNGNKWAIRFLSEKESLPEGAQQLAERSFRLLGGMVYLLENHFNEEEQEALLAITFTVLRAFADTVHRGAAWKEEGSEEVSASEVIEQLLKEVQNQSIKNDNDDKPEGPQGQATTDDRE